MNDQFRSKQSKATSDYSSLSSCRKNQLLSKARVSSFKIKKNLGFFLVSLKSRKLNSLGLDRFERLLFNLLFALNMSVIVHTIFYKQNNENPLATLFQYQYDKLLIASHLACMR